ncbi:uncharacterized protein LOC131875148 [Cryptomeria japonica]|uniref:uncharacterized protein LOC131875148 n=1 Tax=Cryptomeria japonica TaxID=3369 RepID=UPI0027DA3385|nr:uncharacterized protein LOC131875148 [Cryptomeria japonica]
MQLGGVGSGNGRIQNSDSLKGRNSGSNGGSSQIEGVGPMGEKDKPSDILKVVDILQTGGTLPEKKVDSGFLGEGSSGGSSPREETLENRKEPRKWPKGELKQTKPPVKSKKVPEKKTESSKDTAGVVIVDTYASKETQKKEDQPKEGEIPGSQEEKFGSSPLMISSEMQEAQKCAILGINLSDSDQNSKIVNSASHDSRFPNWGNEDEISRILNVDTNLAATRNGSKRRRSGTFCSRANQIARPQPSISESKEDGSDSVFSLDEGSDSDPTRKSEESMDDSEVEVGKKRKYLKTGPSSSKGKKSKGKILQISSSEEEVSEDSEKNLSHRIQILETINTGEAKTMVDYMEDLTNIVSKAENIRDSFNPRFEQIEKDLLQRKANANAMDQTI